MIIFNSYINQCGGLYGLTLAKEAIIGSGATWRGSVKRIAVGFKLRRTT